MRTLIVLLYLGVCLAVPHKQIIAFCLYGNNPLYTEGALDNAELVPKIYPGWTMRLYYDSSVSRDLIDQLRVRNVELFNMTDYPLGPNYRRCWRFLPMTDPDVIRFISRDVDSRISMREKYAVDEWIASGKHFHLMRDHPYECPSAPYNHYILAGMWGALGNAIPDFEQLLLSAALGEYHWADQDFLAKHVWPIARHSVIQHDSYTCHLHGGVPFPTRRVGNEFIGSKIRNGANIEPHIADIVTRTRMPPQCVPKGKHDEL